MGLTDLETIPETGAVFTTGRSRFADNIASHFFIRKDPVISITCGDEHSAVICQSGRLFVFGSNDWGQLGLGHKNHISKPSCVKALKPEKVTHVACGRAHTLICTGGQKIFACGSDQEGQLGRGTSAIGDSASTPVLVYDSGLAGSKVVQIAAGSHHSLALTSDGGVFAWGSNLEGQLGLPDVSGLVNKPTKVHIPEPVKQISAGYYHSTFLTESGLVYACGESESGKLGIDVNFSTQAAPKQMQLPSPAVRVACGGHHTLILAENGNLYCTGNNSSGQIGLGTNLTQLHTPKLLPRGAIQNEKITQISCGESHTAIVTETGKLFTCGDGRHGKLGLEENENNVHELTFVPRYKELFVLNVACGGCHTILVGQRRETNNHTQKEMDNSQMDHLQKRNSLPPLKVPIGKQKGELRDGEVNEIIKDQLNLTKNGPATIMNVQKTMEAASKNIDKNVEYNKDSVLNDVTDSMNGARKAESPAKSAKSMEVASKETPLDASEASKEAKLEEKSKEMTSDEMKTEASRSNTKESQVTKAQNEKGETVKNENKKSEVKRDIENNVAKEEKKSELTNGEANDNDNNNEVGTDTVKSDTQGDEKSEETNEKNDSKNNNNTEGKDEVDAGDNKQSNDDEVKSEPPKERMESKDKVADVASKETTSPEKQMSPADSTPPPKPPRLKPESGNSSMEKENEDDNVEKEAKAEEISETKEETIKGNDESEKKEGSKSGSSKSSRSKVDAVETIEIDKQNDKEKIVEENKANNDNSQDDADVVQSPPPRTGKISKIFKSTRERKTEKAIENGTKTSDTVNHKSKSKTCTIL